MIDQATEQVEQALLGGPRRYTKTETAEAAGVSLARSQRILAGSRIRRRG